MKICYITEYFPTGGSLDIRGGAEVVAFYEAKHLANVHEVDVITSYEPGSRREDKIENINVFRCGKMRGYVQKNAFFDRLRFMRSAYLMGIKRKYDLVVGFSIITYPVAWKISRKQQIPCSIRYHDVLIGRWIKTFGVTGFLGEIFERYTLSRSFAAIIAVSNYTANNVRKYFRDKEKVFVVHNGVEVPDITIEKETKPTVCCVSRLVSYKHIDDLIRAVAILKKDFPDIQCKIVGTGPEEDRLKSLVSRTELEKHITFYGFVKDHDDVLKIIKSSHVFCLPSSVEGFGIVIVESMACGVPFVASEIAPIIEASGRKGGLFFKTRDVSDLSRQIKSILENPSLQISLIDEGAKRALEFNWINISAKAESIYLKTIREWKP
jgi:glycosyltransferase involved in cell wall biosynthesis